MVYKHFDKKYPSFSNNYAKGTGFKSAIKQNQQLTKELHEPIIRKFEKQKYIQVLKTIFKVLILQICN